MEMQIFSPDDLALMGHLALCNPGLNGKTIDSIIIFLIALRGKGGREGGRGMGEKSEQRAAYLGPK